MSKLFFFVVLVYAFFNIIQAEKQCDDKGVLIYEDLACKPIHSSDSHCPNSFECDNFKSSTEYCLIAGEKIPAGTRIPSNLTGRCFSGCICSHGRVRCPQVDCPENFGRPITPGCTRKFTTINQCCSSGENCPLFDNLITCEVNGEMFRKDEIFYPKDSCHECICLKGFNRTYEEPYCRRRKCSIQTKFLDKIEKNCAPVYKKNEIICCPSTWICPTDTDVIEPSALISSDSESVCKFGDKKIKVGAYFNKNVTEFGRTKVYGCSCRIPPFLTCIDPSQ